MTPLSTAADQFEFRTFRDPVGSIQIERDRVVRTVQPQYVGSVRELRASAFYQQLEAGGQVVSTQVVADSSEGMTLQHPRLWFATYPWEWTVGQWRAAAELTLSLQQQAIAAGYVLKDATPLNVLFNGTNPQLVDVLSFERRDPKSPVWLAYAQFVRTFLLPMIAHRWLRWPLSATASRRDGFEPHEIYAALPWLRRWHPHLLWPVTLPVMLEGKASNATATSKARSHQQKPEIATIALQNSAVSLLKQVRRAAPVAEKSAWSQYESTAQHYTAAEVEQKHEFVASALRQAAPASVLDVGANTGTFSLMAAKAGARVIALEADPAAADRIFQRAAEANADVQPLLANLAWPTPAYGWQNAETHSLLERMANKFDMVLMLAVVHHLLLHDQVPLANIAHLLSQITRQWLLLEWVPVSDPMFQQLLRGRDELYGHLTEQDWIQASAPYFHVDQRQALSNGRIMLLLRRRADAS